MHNVQIKGGLSMISRVSDRISLIGGSGMGGYVHFPLISFSSLHTMSNKTYAKY